MAALVSRPPGRYQVVRPVNRARIANVATWTSTTSVSTKPLKAAGARPVLSGLSFHHWADLGSTAFLEDGRW